MSYRSPFFDRNLIQVAYSIPDSLKIRNGRDKYILRRALKSIVPDELLNVPKSLQRMKYDVDFSNTLDEISDRLLSRENVIRRGFFDYSDIERLRKRKTDKPYSGEGAMRLWTALLTETWAQEFLDKRGAGPRSSPESQ
jgi:asparagine synthase (glutamine-hydrolysing)